MSIVGLDPPDFRTVSDFRKRHLKALAGLFGQVLKLCEQAGFVKLRPCRARRDEDQGERLQAQGAELRAHGEACGEDEAEVAKWLSAAEAVDAEEDRAFGRDKSGEELPE